jgi:hypothetical protein
LCDEREHDVGLGGEDFAYSLLAGAAQSRR